MEQLMIYQRFVTGNVASVSERRHPPSRCEAFIFTFRGIMFPSRLCHLF